MKKYFGTDGIRGKANIFPVTPEIALKLGMATGFHFRGIGRPLFIIGKDTRLSGYVLENAVASGLAAMGVNVYLTGPITTPGVAYLTKKVNASGGIVISASHNKYQDNGLKIFNNFGYKLSDNLEMELEQLIDDPELDKKLAINDRVGKVFRMKQAVPDYIEFLLANYHGPAVPKGFKIVLDCANGASYKIAPQIFEKLGCTVKSIGVSPNGLNINSFCGATYTRQLQETVLNTGADIGISFDGDGDRLIICDEQGLVVDGDQVIAFLVENMLEAKTLKSKKIVTTVMSNLGLEKWLQKRGLELVRAKVGDRYVMEKMIEIGSNIGGEQSGHIILHDYTTTGDGMLTAIKFLEALFLKNIPVSGLLKDFKHVPQRLENIEVKEKRDFSQFSGLDKLNREFKKELGDTGRYLFRYSGTEMKLRIMVEAEDQDKMNKWVERYVQFFKSNI